MNYPLYYNGIAIGTVEHTGQGYSFHLNVNLPLSDITIEPIVKEGELIAFEVINKTIYY